jgi:hypothetical protein
MGGVKMRLYQPEDGIYKLATDGSGPIVTYDFRNERYTMTAIRSGSFSDDILGFTQGKWIKPWYPAAVKMGDGKGDVIV